MTSQTITSQIDLARRALRGDQALQAAGFTPAAIKATQGSSQAAGASSLQHAKISQTAAGTWALVPAVAGQRIEVYSMLLWSEVAQNLELFDGSESLTGLLKAWPSETALLLPFTGEPWFELTAGQPFNLAMSAPGQISGFIRYRTN